MKNELYFYDIFPKVVPINKPATITIKPLSLHTYFNADAEYEIKIFGINQDVYTESKPNVKGYCSKVKDGAISFTHSFESEQEYSVRICKLDGEGWLCNLSVYALESDLMERKPLIGDFHVHSCFSDGREGPDFVAAMYRQNGYDFIPLTDHRGYNASLYAIEQYKDLDLDFKLYRGEEIHSPENNVHLVNFGSDFSVNELCYEDLYSTKNAWHGNGNRKQSWYDEVAELQSTLTDLPAGIDPYTHASCLLAIKKVREGNGMCIFPHPHWLADIRHITDEFSIYYLENGFADAFEIIGGQSWHENMTQIALYHELRAKGAVIPIVGSSDSHGTVNPMHVNGTSICHYFTEEKTMVFSKENSRDEIISAVKGLYSVAVDHYSGQDFHINGPYRLVQYALFLEENFFPLHDELCYEEGRLMRMYIGGDNVADAKARLDALKGQTQRQFKKYFMAN